MRSTVATFPAAEEALKNGEQPGTFSSECEVEAVSAFSSEFCKAHSPTSEFCRAHLPTSEYCNKAQAPTSERSEVEALGALSSERCEVKASASKCCADALSSECCEVETQGSFSSECHDNEVKAPASESREAAGAVGMFFNESCEVQA